jgi:hypothetical protein
MRWSWVLLLIVLVPQPSRSQDALEKAAWVGGSTVLLGVYDYVGYNLSHRNPTTLTGYRISFYLLQAALTYILYEKFGLPSAIGLNLIWWTFGVDMVYYAICELNPHGSDAWAGKGSWASDSRSGIGHANWTPIGLLRGGRGRIAGDTIVAQSLAGAAIGISISITL